MGTVAHVDGVAADAAEGHRIAVADGDLIRVTRVVVRGLDHFTVRPVHRPAVAQNPAVAIAERGRICAAPEDHPVVAVPSRDSVAAILLGGCRGQGSRAVVGPGVAQDHVVAVARVDHVAGVAAHQDIVADAGRDRVHTSALGRRGDLRARGLARHRAGIAQCDHARVPGGQPVGPGPQKDHRSPRGDRDDIVAAGRAGRGGDIAVVVGPRGAPDRAVVAQDHIAAIGRRDGVGAKPADDQIIARPADHRIVPRLRPRHGGQKHAVRKDLDRTVVAKDIVSGVRQGHVIVAAAHDGIEEPGPGQHRVVPVARVRGIGAELGQTGDLGADLGVVLEVLRGRPGPRRDVAARCQQRSGIERENPVIAQQDQPARARRDMVVARATDHDVGDVSARAVAHDDGVVAIVRRHDPGDRGVRHVDDPEVAQHDIAAQPRGDVIVALAPDDQVVAVAGRHGIRTARRRALRFGIGHGFRYPRPAQEAEVAQHRVRSLKVDDGLGPDRRAARDQDVVARIPAQRIGSGISRSVELRVDRLDEQVRGHGKPGKIPDDRVVAVAARQGVVAATAQKQIGPGAAPDGVVSIRRVPCRKHDRLTEVGRRVEVVDGQGRPVLDSRDVERAADQNVDALPAADRVVASATLDQVVAQLSVQRIVPRPAHQHVRAVANGQRVDTSVAALPGFARGGTPAPDGRDGSVGRNAIRPCAAFDQRVGTARDCHHVVSRSREDADDARRARTGGNRVGALAGQDKVVATSDRHRLGVARRLDLRGAGIVSEDLRQGQLGGVPVHVRPVVVRGGPGRLDRPVGVDAKQVTGRRRGQTALGELGQEHVPHPHVVIADEDDVAALDIDGLGPLFTEDDIGAGGVRA